MLKTRSLLATLLFALSPATLALVADMRGVTATEIKIGNIMPYSGPASAYGAIGKVEAAFFKMVNENGGINGCMINFDSLDDGYSPPKAVEDARQLVEQDGVAFVYNLVGVPPSTPIQKYLT